MEFNGEGSGQSFLLLEKIFLSTACTCQKRFSSIARKSTADSSQRTVAKRAQKKIVAKKKGPITADLWLSRKGSWSYGSYLVLSTIGSNFQIPVDDSHLSS